ncbi:MAG: hypothetical protein WC321_00870 [Candidatus Omnitrophota bacterium]|jgi:uncharacterized membrane protein
MLILVRLVGVYLMAAGIIILLWPKAYNRILNFFRQGRRIYIAGILRILFGVLLLSSAAESRLKIFLMVLGVLAIIGGSLIFILKPAKLQAAINWFDKKSPVFIRLWGGVALALGAILVYSI